MSILDAAIYAPMRILQILAVAVGWLCGAVLLSMMILVGVTAIWMTIDAILLLATSIFGG